MDGRELPRDGIILSFLLDGLKEASSGYTIKYWKQGNSTFQSNMRKYSIFITGNKETLTGKDYPGDMHQS